MVLFVQTLHFQLIQEVTNKQTHGFSLVYHAFKQTVCLQFKLTRQCKFHTVFFNQTTVMKFTCIITSDLSLRTHIRKK